MLQTRDRLNAIHGRECGRAVGVTARHMTMETALDGDIEVARKKERARLRKLDEKGAAAWRVARCLENTHGTVAENVEVAVDERRFRPRVPAEQLRHHAHVRWVRQRPRQLVTVEDP